MIHNTVRLKEAVCAGQSIIHFDKRSIATKDYLDLADEIIRRSVDEKAIIEQETSWLMNQLDVTNSQPDEMILDEVSPLSSMEYNDELPQENNILSIDGSDHSLHRVELSYQDYLNRDLKIAGEFNDWIPDEGIETIEENGTLHKIFFAPAGEYQYRLVIDGKWRNDPTNPEQIVNPLGVHNSMLRVGDGPRTQAPNHH